MIIYDYLALKNALKMNDIYSVNNSPGIKYNFE